MTIIVTVVVNFDTNLKMAKQRILTEQLKMAFWKHLKHQESKGDKIRKEQARQGKDKAKKNRNKKSICHVNLG